MRDDSNPSVTATGEGDHDGSIWLITMPISVITIDRSR
jgi:hypothetical protein